MKRFLLPQVIFPAVFLALVACAVWAAVALDGETRTCADWAEQNGLSGRAVTAACETGTGSADDEMSEAQFEGRLDDSLEDLLRIIEQDGGL